MQDNSVQIVEHSVQECFNFGRSDLTIPGYSKPTPFTPKPDADYVFREEYIRIMLAFWFSGDIALKLVGFAGCGKTSIVQQWHSRLNLPLLVVVAHPRMEIADLIGHYVPTEGGGMRFHHGPVALAAMKGYSVLIDEYAALDPGVAVGLNNIIEGGMMVIPETGEVIHPASGFRFFASTNPNDVACGFMGRNTQDASNDDRFWTMNVSYPTAQEEVPIIQRVLMDGMEEGSEDIAKMYAERMVDVANDVRKMYIGESDANNAIDITISTRSLRRWAALFTMFDVPDAELYSLKLAITNRASKETALAIENVVTTKFGTT